MTVSAPFFHEGREWRTLTRNERNGKPWKYILMRDVFIEVETGLRDHYDCRCGDKIWGMILPHGIVIKRGYAWNGNTASPDELMGNCLRLPSLPHDVLFQFSGAIGFPRHTITLSWANTLYYKLAPRWIGWAYLTGLTIGSWLLWGRRPTNGEHVECKPLHQAEPT